MASSSSPLESLSRDVLEQLTGTRIGDLSIYQRALTHRSLLRDPGSTEETSYERLEYLGDALLDFIIAEVLYQRFPEKNEGFLTRLRVKLVSNPSLARFARSMGIGPYLRVTANAARSGARDNPSILSDAFEALLAAVYLDQGLPAAQQFVRQNALAAIDLEAEAIREQNFKSLLQEHLHAEGRALPSYHVVDEHGPSHARVYEVEVYVEGQPKGYGKAKSKKRAEQQAAAEALDVLRHDATGNAA